MKIYDQIVYKLWKANPSDFHGGRIPEPFKFSSALYAFSIFFRPNFLTQLSEHSPTIYRSKPSLQAFSPGLLSQPPVRFSGFSTEKWKSANCKFCAAWQPDDLDTSTASSAAQINPLFIECRKCDSHHHSSQQIPRWLFANFLPSPQNLKTLQWRVSSQCRVLFELLLFRRKENLFESSCSNFKKTCSCSKVIAHCLLLVFSVVLFEPGEFRFWSSEISKPENLNFGEEPREMPSDAKWRDPPNSLLCELGIPTFKVLNFDCCLFGQDALVALFPFFLIIYRLLFRWPSLSYKWFTVNRCLVEPYAEPSEGNE